MPGVSRSRVVFPLLLSLGLAVPALADGGMLSRRVPRAPGEIAVVAGTVTFYGAGDRLLLLVDRSDGGTPADGVVDLAVRFGIEGRLPQGRLRTVDGAVLLVRQDRVVVTSAAGPVALELTVADEGGAVPLAGLPAEAAFRDPGVPLLGGAHGFELAVVDLSHRPVPERSKWDALAAGGSPLLPRSERATGNCDSGGMGATSCSVTCSSDGGCSVACGQGWFPCCNCDPGAYCFCCRIAGGA